MYLGWWFLVELLLPGSFNPLSGRLVIVALMLAVVLASYRSGPIATHIPYWFCGCASLATLHYFYLFYRNRGDINWVVGSYITVIAVCACLETATSFLFYGVYVLLLSVSLCLVDQDLFRTVFLPGMMTLLLFGYFSLRARLRLASQNWENAQRLQSLFDGVFEGICLHDGGKILDANQSFAKMFGYERRETFGKMVTDFVIPEVRSQVLEKVHTMNEIPYESSGLRKDGTYFPIEVLGKPHFSDGKTLRIAAIRDLTDTKKGERNRVLLEASRTALAMRDEFISIASHELKTPLTTIKIQAQMIERGFAKNDSAPSPEQVRSFAKKIDRQTNRLNYLIEDMLYSSRLSFGNVVLELQTFALSDFTQRVIGTLSESFKQAQVEVTFQGEPGIQVEADPGRMEQVLVNLLSNGLKYGNGKPLVVSVVRIGETAVVSVQDQGMGIAPEDQERVFQRFERAVSARKISGMGLGLFICRQIIEAHGGRIELQSQVGQGTTFLVTLPLKSGEPPIP